MMLPVVMLYAMALIATPDPPKTVPEAIDWGMPLAIYTVSWIGLDYGSSRYAFAQGWEEGHPFMRETGVALALKAAWVAGATWLDVEFQKRGEHKKARLMRKIVFVVSCAIAARHLTARK